MASLIKTYTGDLSVAIAKRLIELGRNLYGDGFQFGGGNGGSNVSGKDPMVPNRGGGGSDPINPEVVSSTPFDGLVKKPSITNTAPRQAGIVVHDQKLGNFLAAVSISLSSSLNTANQKLDDSSEGIIAAKDGIDNTYKKLEQHSDSLESKLDDIIQALNHSNKIEKEKRDKKESDAKIAEQKEDVDLSNSNRILMQDMDRQEVRDLQRENMQDDFIDDAAMSPQPPTNDDDGIDVDSLPSLDRGGIVSGPDSGYLAVLHGDEAVIPLDNNYTQGQPSAVGKEPISNMPMMAEQGIMGDNPRSMKPTFTPNVNVSPVLKKTNNADDLAKAIQIPAKAAGLVTMGIMGNALRQSLLPPGILGNLKTLTSPIAQAFGIPDVLSANQAERTENMFAQNQKRQEVLEAKRGRRQREKGILGKIKEFLFGGGAGTGGGSMTYRGGTGGNTYMNNRTSGTSGTGGYGTGGWPFGGKKPSDSIKELRYRSDHPLGTEQPNPFKPGSTLYKNFEKMREMDRYGVLDISSSGGDSQFFAKNVSYDNAFDYKKFSSPEYGLKTSEIAYNMSMADEVNTMVDGISDPSSQVVLNNHTSSTNAGNQIEYSAIAVKGNPLKEGTYLSPYAV